MLRRITGKIPGAVVYVALQRLLRLSGGGLVRQLQHGNLPGGDASRVEHRASDDGGPVNPVDLRHIREEVLIAIPEHPALRRPLALPDGVHHLGRGPRRLRRFRPPAGGQQAAQREKEQHKPFHASASSKLLGSISWSSARLALFQVSGSLMQ